MFRVYLYSAAYLISLLIFVFLNSFSWSEGLIFFAFIASTLYYTFSREELPSKKILNYPEAFKYRADRINIYGNGMLACLVLCSALFAFNLSAGFISQTILVLIVWPIIILTSYILIRVHSYRERIYPIYEFAVNNTGYELDLVDFIWLLSNFENLRDFDALPKTFAKYNTKMLRETYNSIKSFHEIANINIGSGEIEEIENSSL